MKNEYDFSKGKRGAVVKSSPGKTRITIRIDADIIDWFRDAAHSEGGGSYQTMINDALRKFIGGYYEDLEDTVRRVVREELSGYGTRPSAAEPRSPTASREGFGRQRTPDSRGE